MRAKNYWYRYLGAEQLGEGGSLRIAGQAYTLRDGILRQSEFSSGDQERTGDTFGFKWSRRMTYESEHFQAMSREWLSERYLGGNQALLNKLCVPGLKVLDAGCGSGYSALLFFDGFLNNMEYLGVDISNAVEVAAQRFREKGYAGEFIQSDLMRLPFSGPVFDMIFSEGVLHHTDSTEKAFTYLSSLLRPGGVFLLYVYRKKGPVREFTDDYIRHALKDMDDQAAWDALVPLTKLGKELGDLAVRIKIPEAIPFLEIPAGEIDLQRLFYWHVCKAYYKQDWSIDEMNHLNFDWFKPSNCHRHTPEEIQQWCSAARMTIERMDVQESGITVIARKET